MYCYVGVVFIQHHICQKIFWFTFFNSVCVCVCVYKYLSVLFGKLSVFGEYNCGMCLHLLKRHILPFTWYGCELGVNHNHVQASFCSVLYKLIRTLIFTL